MRALIKKIIIASARVVIKGLRFFSPMRQRRIMNFFRQRLARILPTKLYLEIDRLAKKSLQNYGVAGANLYQSPPKKLETKYDIICAPQNQLAKVDIIICCAFLGRERQLNLAIEESQFSKKNIIWALMGSSDEDRETLSRLANKYQNIHGAICKNEPVGAKWQTCVDFAIEKNKDFDLLCITGSDDIIAACGFDYIHERFVHNSEQEQFSALSSLPSLYCTSGWYIYNRCEGHPYHQALFKANYNKEFMSQPLGAGRFYTKNYLSSIKNFLFDCELNKNLDNWGYENLIIQGKEAVLFSRENVPILSIKKRFEMNGFETIMQSRNITMHEMVFQERSDFFSKFNVDIKRYKL